MQLRAETVADLPHIRRLIEAAFGREDEARLVDRLRGEAPGAISLVAEIDGEVAGHVMLSPLIAPAGAMALAPVSVRPDLHGRGIGAALVREGLARATASGARAVFVLGDPPYYARFGFHTQTARGFASPYAGPFQMALELVPGALAAKGPLTYPRAFDDLAD